jgi:hypothetical protein
MTHEAYDAKQLEARELDSQGSLPEHISGLVQPNIFHPGDMNEAHGHS